MKRFRLAALTGVFGLSVSILGIYLLSDAMTREEPYPTQIQGEASEHATARAEWEFRRLRDPATGQIPPDIRARELEFAATLPMRDGSSLLLKSTGAAEYGGWVHRGPVNIGGRTRALGVDISGEDTILAGGVSGGMWRSSDGGRSWARTTLPSAFPGTSCLVQDTRPGKNHIWYYGTGEIIGGSTSAGGAYYSGNGLYKSLDNGRTWTSLARTASATPHTFDLIFDYVWNVVVDPSSSTQDEVYAATYGGVSRSTNGGDRWTSVLVDVANYSAYVDVAVSDSGVVYATLSDDGGKKGIWRSTNGTTWKAITPTGWPPVYRRTVIGIAPSNPDVVYFVAETPGYGFLGKNFRGDSVWSSLWKYTYLSGDGTADGGKWEDLTGNLPSLGGSFGDFNPQSSYNLHIKVKPDDENVVYLGGTNLYRSNDGFASKNNTTWIGGYRNIVFDSTAIVELHYPDHHPDQHLILFSKSNPSVIYTGSDGGVHRSDNGMADTINWVDLNAGYLTSQFYTVAIDHATPGSQLIVGGLQDNGTWSTSSSSFTEPWVRRSTGDGSYCRVVNGAREMYVSKQQGKTYRLLLDGDGSVTGETRVDPLGATNYDFINPFILDPADQNVMYLLGGRYIWRNSDLRSIPLGSTKPATSGWTRLESTKVADTVLITALSISTSNPSRRVWFGTDNGEVYRIDDPVGSEPTIISKTDPAFPKGGNVNCIAVDPNDGNRAVVVFSNYLVQSLFLTTDAGATWSPISGNLEQTPNGSGNGPSCRWFSFLHRSNGTVFFVATSTGLWSTTSLNGMSTVWQLEGAESIGNVVVDMIDVRQTDGYVVVGTHANGVYSTTIDALGVESDAVADGSMLDQNYPNPVVDATTIRYRVPAGTLRLILFDITGREVAMLMEERVAAGEGEARIDFRSGTLRALPAGRYYYRLQSGESFETHALQLVR